jgi:hypothetical protein
MRVRGSWIHDQLLVRALFHEVPGVVGAADLGVEGLEQAGTILGFIRKARWGYLYRVGLFRGKR